jgi:hypothetical protein
MLALEMGLGVHGIGLVVAAKALELALGIGGVHVFAQHGAAAGALHLHQLVDQHIAGGADVARKPGGGAADRPG